VAGSKDRESVAPASALRNGRLVLRSREVTERSLAGGKAYALARLSHAFEEIPAWFVISPAAFLASLDQQQQAVFQTQGFTPELLETLNPSVEVREQVSAALDEIAAADEFVAVRSSAVEEDSAVASVSGQQESYINV
jgi:phosphoenolpyruvate synthase/pyruvate phosphate dikinase